MDITPEYLARELEDDIHAKIEHMTIEEKQRFFTALSHVYFNLSFYVGLDPYDQLELAEDEIKNFDFFEKKKPILKLVR